MTRFDISLDEPFALQILSASTQHDYIDTVDITYPNVNSTANQAYIHTLANYIRSNKKIKKLKLFLYKSLPPQIAENIFNALKTRTATEQNNNPRQIHASKDAPILTELEANLSGIEGDKLPHFISYLRTTTTLQKLRLKTDIDDSVASLATILETVQKNKSIESISISSFIQPSCLDDTQVEQLLEIVKNKKLRSLSLSGHQLSSDAMSRLCYELRFQKNLQSLNLASTQCTNEQLASIRFIIEAKNSSLQAITVGQKVINKEANQITESGIDYFLEGIKNCSILKHLTIGFINNDILATKIAAIMQENKSLESITLKYSPHQSIGQKGATHLINALKENTTLVKFVEEHDKREMNKNFEAYGRNLLINNKLSKKITSQIDGLLERNKLIKAIQTDVYSLSAQLKKFKYATFDDTFFVTLFKVLPEPFLLKYNDSLTKLILHSQSKWNLFRRNKNNVKRINNIISLLSLQAQKGEDNSKLALSYIYKNGLLNQQIEPSTARDIFNSIISTSKNEEALNKAHFEIAHLNLIYPNNDSALANAASYFDKVASDSNYKIAARLRDHCINRLNGSDSLVLPDGKTIEEQLSNFRRLGNAAFSFNLLNNPSVKVTNFRATTTTQEPKLQPIEANVRLYTCLVK